MNLTHCVSYKVIQCALQGADVLMETAQADCLHTRPEVPELRGRAPFLHQTPGAPAGRPASAAG
ncbi:hypothetical protein DNTS_030047 [Danionella cerebrum]|uniref:Uncharacterized protein n=1 Tax=Danionella cerebrum TaxID=2873325 RepID=A0A553MZH4_9TELE|nr:hypothetical protein DNTS_030047 [Danionella translucida]